MTQIQSLLLTLEQAGALVSRARTAKGFGGYLRERRALVIAACLLLAPLPMACTAGVLGFFGQMHAAFMLLGMVLAPLVLIGSTLVVAYLLFSWLETRALERALGRPVAHPLTAVPWLPAGVLVALPLAMLAIVAPLASLGALLCACAAPLSYTRIERAGGLQCVSWYLYQYFGRLTSHGGPRADSRSGPAAPRRGRGA